MGLQTIARDGFINSIITEVKKKGAKVITLKLPVPGAKKGAKNFSLQEFRTAMHRACIFTEVSEGKTPFDPIVKCSIKKEVA